MALHKKKEIVPEFTKLVQSLRFALCQAHKRSGVDYNAVVEKYIHEYFRKLYHGPGRGREFIFHEYATGLDDKRLLYPAPKYKGHLKTCLENYVFSWESYQLPVSRAKELLDRNRKPQRFSPSADYEAKKRVSRSGDDDTERLKDLINLIQCRKKNVGGDCDFEDPRIRSGLKRKLEEQSGNLQKYLKMSDASESICHCEGKKVFV